MRSPKLRGAALVIALASACSSGGGGGHTAAPTTTAPAYRLDGTLRLDQVQVLGSHNSYHGRPYPQALARPGMIEAQR